MDKDIKLLLVPDVHGRDFWREPVMANLDKPIVFLGDYLDPYKHEGITREHSIEVFKEIVDLRKENDNITLLLGNHDCSYAFRTDICECRHDWDNHRKIADIFHENLDLFDIAKERVINKKRFFISHAGLHKSWIKYNTYIFPEGFKATAKNLNELLHDPDTKKDFAYALRDLSFYRGGYDGFGSIVWSDIREFVKSKEILNAKRIQIVGHTMLDGVAIRVSKNMYCIDCQKVFYIDSKGVIRYYDTDEEITIGEQYE